MSQKNFSIEEALKFCWDTMKANLWFFVGILIIAGLIEYIPSTIAMLLERDIPGLAFLFRVIGWVVSIIVAIGMIRIALKILDGEKAELKDLFSFRPFFWKYLVGSVLSALIVLGGLILLIIPGFIWAIKFQYYGYLIIDKKLDAIEALKNSGKITNGVKWNLLGFGSVLFCINIVGVLALFIGLFATIPLTMMATAFVYRKLLSQTEAIPPTDVLQAPPTPA